MSTKKRKFLTSVAVLITSMVIQTNASAEVNSDKVKQNEDGQVYEQNKTDASEDFILKQSTEKKEKATGHSSHSSHSSHQSHQSHQSHYSSYNAPVDKGE